MYKGSNPTTTTKRISQSEFSLSLISAFPMVALVVSVMMHFSLHSYPIWTFTDWIQGTVLR